MKIINLIQIFFLILLSFFLLNFHFIDTEKTTEILKEELYGFISNDEKLLSKWSDDYIELRDYKKKIILTSKKKFINLGFYFTNKDIPDFEIMEHYFKSKFNRIPSDRKKPLICGGENYCFIQTIHSTNIIEIDEKLKFLKKKYNYVFINNQWRILKLNNEEF